MSARKKKPVIQLPKITGSKSGMVKKGKFWHLLYYEDGKLRSFSTGNAALRLACIAREVFHKNLIEEGASYKGDASAKPSVLAAKKNPKGMACIYTQVTYKVVVAGEHVITTSDVERAKAARNNYINLNF